MAAKKRHRVGKSWAKAMARQDRELARLKREAKRGPVWGVTRGVTGVAVATILDSTGMLAGVRSRSDNDEGALRRDMRRDYPELREVR